MSSRLDMLSELSFFADGPRTGDGMPRGGLRRVGALSLHKGGSHSAGCCTRARARTTSDAARSVARRRGHGGGWLRGEAGGRHRGKDRYPAAVVARSSTVSTRGFREVEHMQWRYDSRGQCMRLCLGGRGERA